MEEEEEEAGDGRRWRIRSRRRAVATEAARDGCWQRRRNLGTAAAAEKVGVGARRRR